MKFVSAITSALIGTCYAGSNAMQAQFNNLVSEMNITDRVFSGNLSATILSLNEYGCWCYFDDDHGRGKAQPADGVDSVCKVLHDGYDCAMLDAENRGETCTPWEVLYDAAVGGSTLTIAEECAIKNVNACSRDACTVEGTFVANLLSVMVTTPGGAIADSNRQSQGFDVGANCVTKRGGQGGEKQCCGTFPNRFPFKTLGGDRGCCVDRTFNTATLNCCSDGSVKFNC